MIKKEIVGYCAKHQADGEYVRPGLNEWGERYIWPTRHQLVSELNDRGLTWISVKILRVVRTTEVGYAIEDAYIDGGYTGRYYSDGVGSSCREEPYLWPTREEAQLVYNRLKLSQSRIVEMPFPKTTSKTAKVPVKPEVSAKKYIIRKRHTVEYDTRELAEQVAETYAGGSLCWMVVEA